MVAGVGRVGAVVAIGACVPTGVASNTIMEDEMSYQCALCPEQRANRTSLENHVWKEHQETRCCTAHKSKFKSINTKTCGGHRDIATCATRQVYVERGLKWPPESSSPAKNRAAVDCGEDSEQEEGL